MDRNSPLTFATCALLIASAPSFADAPAADASLLDRVVVQANNADSGTAASISTIDGADVAAVDPTHPSELFDRVPGVWISRGSGQELLSAIRSPVLNGTGACGEILWSEDGVPIRPAGFCNVNGLFELDFEQSAAVEVLRGPGSALQGSNALHGVINVVSPSALADVSAFGVELGSYDFAHTTASWSRTHDGVGIRIDALATGAGSFRDDESYGLQKLRVRADRSGESSQDVGWLSAVNLNQETAGYITGFDAYRDLDRTRRNENPDAFRDARAARAGWRHTERFSDVLSLETVVYGRTDEQRFLQHFNPGKPLERDRDSSVGAQALVRESFGAITLAAGTNLEVARGSVFEFQSGPVIGGTPLQQAIRPIGVHYDYDADATSAALFAELDWALSDQTHVDIGWRVETLDYRYDNLAATGNLRDDGSACSSGGCLFNRPADRSDRFTHAAPKLGLVQTLTPHLQTYARAASGFRFPQAGELYRLQRGQNVADLRTETLDSFEVGLRGQRDGIVGDVALYTMRKSHWLFRDANGFNVADGRTHHDGVELDLDVPLGRGFAVSTATSYSIQRYAFDSALGGGERIVDGNDIDTAPRWLSNTRLSWSDDARRRVELEAAYTGRYYLDATNTATYPGQLLWNLRYSQPLAHGLTLAFKLINVTDRRYADRADFAFGEYRYFPGAPRSVFVSLDWRS